MRSKGAARLSSPPASREDATGVVDTAGPEVLLQRSLAAEDPALRERWARAALARKDDVEIAPDTHFLLLRQLYLASAEADRWRDAAAIAEDMAKVGVFVDLALNDLSRAKGAMDDVRGALAAQRRAVTAAPPNRRSFQGFCLATLLFFEGDVEAAIEAVDEAEQHAQRDRPLVRALGAWLRLEAGLAVPGLGTITSALARSRAREGYGQFLLGMIAHHVGDRPRASAHLRAFLRRNAAIDRAKVITLREELHRARRALAELESD